MQTVFRSDDLPVADRLPRFDEFQVHSSHPMRVFSDDPRRFRATARAVDFADLNLVRLTTTASEIRRTSALVRRFDPELYSVVLPVGGRVIVRQDGREAELAAGDLALYTSSRPFDVRTGADGEPVMMLRAHVPRRLVSVPERAADRLVAVRLPGRDGVGGLLADFFTRLAGGGHYAPADAPRLGAVGLDLLTATLAHHVDAARPAPAPAALLTRITAYIQRHLHDPDLAPGSIAGAHHISLSYLHRLFTAHDMTVAAWIRHQRLEHARRDLADPALRALPVHRIAARWAFADHASFTRAFRAAYDVAPREYRHAISAAATPQPAGPPYR